jgi:hypothetical protein
MPPIDGKRCQQCGQWIRGKRPQAIYCGEHCRNQAYIDRRRQRSARAGPWEPCCLWCDKDLPPTPRSDAVYCSAACRQAYWRWRRT